LIYGQILIELKQYVKAKNVLFNALQICPNNSLLLVTLAVLVNIINPYTNKNKKNKLKKIYKNKNIELLNFELYKNKICGYNDMKELASSEVSLYLCICVHVSMYLCKYSINIYLYISLYVWMCNHM
jgi:hypothetical protein